MCPTCPNFLNYFFTHYIIFIYFKIRVTHIQETVAKLALQKCIHLGSHEKLEKAKDKANISPRNRCKIFMVRTSNPLIENTSSAESTSAETQHKEFTKTQAVEMKLKRLLSV